MRNFFSLRFSCGWAVFFLCAGGAFGGRQAKEIAKRCHKMGENLLSFEQKTVFPRRRKSKPEAGAKHE